MAEDFYQILGVTKSSTEDEIRKAFKKLARKYHPDVNPGDKKAEDQFKKITEAYEVLSHADKRKKYDAYGSADFEGFPGGGGTSYTYGPQGQGRYTSNVDFGDLGDIFGDIFGGGVGARGSRRRPAYQQPAGVRGKDMHFSIDLEFLEAITGVEKKIRLPNGTSFKVKIPSGVQTGSKIRLAGKGEPGIMGGEAGDLYIEATVGNHPYFRKNGTDIELDLPVTLAEALAGAKIRVPTIDGAVDLKIPEGSQSGQRMRLKGKGVEDKKTHERGDQYVILQIRYPTEMDEKLKKQIADAMTDFNPRAHLEDKS